MASFSDIARSQNFVLLVIGVDRRLRLEVTDKFALQTIMALRSLLIALIIEILFR